MSNERFTEIVQEIRNELHEIREELAALSERVNKPTREVGKKRWYNL